MPVHAGGGELARKQGPLELFFFTRAVALIVGGPTHAHCTPTVVRLPIRPIPALASRGGRPRRIRMMRDGISVPGMCDTLLDLFRIKISAGAFPDHLYIATGIIVLTFR